ncbi:MAG: hypothetical protein ACFFB5_22935 [Promethearchaeota archaeon]
MSYLKQLRQRLTKSRSLDEKSEQDESIPQEEDNDAPSKPIKPIRGWKRLLAAFRIFFPLGMYQRGLKWHLGNSSPPLINEINKNDQNIENGKIIHIQEKSFQSRFGYFTSRAILQSIGLSIIFTAPISLPWIFNVVIPFSIDLLPFGLSEIIRDIINRILTFLSPFRVVVDVIMALSNVFGTANPIFFYGSTLWFLTMIGLTDIEVFDAFENTNNHGTGTMIELLGNHYQSKFTLLQEYIAPLLILIAGSISFFLVIRRAKSIIFEVQTEKQQKKNIEKLKRIFIGYYLDDGYNQIDYTENRITSSPKLMWLARIIKYGPIVSVVLPISLAIIFVIL